MPTGDEADGPVKRWTKVMNSFGFVWITFGFDSDSGFDFEFDSRPWKLEEFWWVEVGFGGFLLGWVSNLHSRYNWNIYIFG